MLIAVVKKNALEFPDDPALILMDEQVTWLQLQEKVNHYSKVVKPYTGQRILLYLDGRTVDDVALMIASSSVIAETILVSTFTEIGRATGFLSEFNGDALISAKDGQIQIHAKSERKPIRSVSPQPLVCLLTSGTTGMPKCVQQSWQGLANAVTIHSRFHGRKWMMGYHVTNFAGTQVFLQCFLNAGCLIVPKTFPPGMANDIEALIKYKVQYLNCTPTYARSLLLSSAGRTLDTLLKVTLGGEIVDQQLINSLKENCPNIRITQIYASTELGASLTVTDEREGFPANLIDGVNLKIENDELYARPTNRAMLGYLAQNSSIKTPSTIREDWFSTGDLVEIRGDRVLFLGRRDFVVNVGGFKVNPMLVENVIRTIPGILEAVVSGQKNPITGNILKAKIFLDPSKDPEIIRAEIIELCKLKLPYYAIPRLFEFDKIKHTSSYKLQR